MNQNVGAFDPVFPFACTTIRETVYVAGNSTKAPRTITVGEAEKDRRVEAEVGLRENDRKRSARLPRGAAQKPEPTH